MLREDNCYQGGGLIQQRLRIESWRRVLVMDSAIRRTTKQVLLDWWVTREDVWMVEQTRFFSLKVFPKFLILVLKVRLCVYLCKGERTCNTCVRQEHCPIQGATRVSMVILQRIIQKETLQSRISLYHVISVKPYQNRILIGFPGRQRRTCAKNNKTWTFSDTSESQQLILGLSVKSQAAQHSMTVDPLSRVFTSTVML